MTEKVNKRITIDLDEIGALVEKSGEIMLSPKGERHLVKLLQIEGMLAEAKHKAQEMLAEAAVKMDPNFTTIEGDSIRVAYRSYQSRFIIDQAFADQLPEQVCKTTTKTSLVTKEVDRFFEEHGDLPLGVIERDREKSIYFSDVTTEVGDE